MTIMKTRFNQLDFIIMISAVSLIAATFYWPKFIKAPDYILKRYYGYYTFFIMAEYVPSDIAKLVRMGDTSKNRFGVINGKVSKVMENESTSLDLIMKDGKRIKYIHPSLNTMIIKLKVLCYKVFDETYPDVADMPDLEKSVRPGNQYIFSRPDYTISGKIIAITPLADD